MHGTKGYLEGFEATINFDIDDLSNSSITGRVDANTLNTQNEKRDADLKSEDYFNVETYPKMTFESTSFELIGGKIIMTGKLKIKDIELEEAITFTFTDNVFIGECTIQAANYKIGSFAKKKPEKTNVKISFFIPIM